MRARGFTLLELMVAGSLFLLLGLVLFELYRVGASAWHKSDSQLDVLRNLQVVLTRVSREAQGSSLASESHDATALSFLTAVKDSTGFVVAPVTFRPVWQRYFVCYYDAGRQSVSVREEPLLPASPEASAPGPIDNFAGPSGTQPLAFYCNSGREIARGITSFQASTTEPDLLELTLEGQQKRYGSKKLESIRLKTTVRMRN